MIAKPIIMGCSLSSSLSISFPLSLIFICKQQSCAMFSIYIEKANVFHIQSATEHPKPPDET